MRTPGPGVGVDDYQCPHGLASCAPTLTVSDNDPTIGKRDPACIFEELLSPRKLSHYRVALASHAACPHGSNSCASTT